jgi:hypothetical protein
MNPSLVLTNAGVDTNIFNEAEPTTPESDFTATVTPQSDIWLRMGRTWVSGNVRQDLVWFREFASERSANQRYALGWVAPLNRITVSVGSGWTRARERPGFEIDARAMRTERALNGAVELRALARTHVGIRGERRTVDFREDAVFLGTSLRSELNRNVATVAATVRHELTPLTSLLFTAGIDEERFAFSSLRNSDSRRVTAGVAFKPFALVSGSATIGYRDFESFAPDVPDYAGTTLNVNLGYVALGSTKVTFEALRDVQYSFEASQPYYLQSGLQVAVAQQIYGPFDVEGRLGRQRLAYRDRAGSAPASADRVDRIESLGAGAGYRASPTFRLGFHVERQERTSPVTNRNYRGLRFGLAMTYGL